MWWIVYISVDCCYDLRLSSGILLCCLLSEVASNTLPHCLCDAFTEGMDGAVMFFVNFFSCLFVHQHLFKTCSFRSRPAFKDLKKLGFPILLVTQWTDLSPYFLEMSYEKEFQYVNWERAERMIHPSGILDLLLHWNESIPLRSKKRIITTKRTMKYYNVGNNWMSRP